MKLFFKMKLSLWERLLGYRIKRFGLGYIKIDQKNRVKEWWTRINPSSKKFSKRGQYFSIRSKTLFVHLR